MNDMCVVRFKKSINVDTDTTVSFKALFQVYYLVIFSATK